MPEELYEKLATKVSLTAKRNQACFIVGGSGETSAFVSLGVMKGLGSVRRLELAESV